MNSNLWWASGFLELYSRFQSPGFPDSTSKNFTDSGIWIPLLGAMKNVLLVSQKNLNPGHICIKY